jgi:hypothetical protein
MYEITVDGELCNVWVVKTGKGTWKAYGKFRDRHIEQSNSSESSAVSSWKRIAEFEANA